MEKRFLSFGNHRDPNPVELGAEREELKGFSRSYAELEWLLLLLVLLYVAAPGTFVENKFALVVAMGAFAAFVILFRYVNFYRDHKRWKLVVEAWVLVAFVGFVLWVTGRHESPLINLYLLVIIFSALTLDKLNTMLTVLAIAALYVLMGYSVHGTSIFSLESFSHLMAGLAPFVLVAYLTTMLSADIHAARIEIKALATTDELTRTFNMRAFRFIMEKELEISSRYAKTFSLLMIDADGFKHTNDIFGHGGGDRLLKELAARLQGQLRGADSLARYGGDEFVVLLPETDQDAAAHVAERLRSKVESIRMEEGDRAHEPTISIGLASYPDNGSTITELLNSADRALYESKHKKGNCVTIAS